MIRQLIASAVFAGFAAGLIAAALQLVFVQPLLLEAELYESGALIHFAGEADAHDHATHAHPDPSGAFDLARAGLSVLFSTLVYTGYGLLLVAGFALAARYGLLVDARRGLLWGVAGFVAVQLAPAAGLPPELPGSAGAEITSRQIWWFSTAGVSVLGLALIAFGRGWPLMLIAVAALLAPHIIGAPHAAAMTGTAPPELAGAFAGRTLAVGLAAWALLGTIAAYFWQQLDKD